MSETTASAVEAGPRADADLLLVGAAFLRAFADYAGWRAVLGAALVGAGALLENVSVVLLISFLSVTMNETEAASRIGVLATSAFETLHLETRLSRIALLLGVFAALLLLRAFVNLSTGRVLADLRAGFVEQRRANLLRALAQTPWEQVLRLRHARILQVINADMRQLAAASFFLVEGAVAGVMLLAQCVLAFLLAPAFAAFAAALIALAALAGRRLMRESYALGAALTQDNLALNQALSAFLGGLKLAIGQNLQGGFVTEFEFATGELRRRQAEFQMQQAQSGAAVHVLSGLAGCICAFVGFGLLDMPAPMVFALLYLFARLSGPVQQLMRGTQQLVHNLPAFEQVRKLESDLASAAPTQKPPAPLDATGTIIFRNVTYLHGANEKGTRGLRDLDLTLEHGEILGVAGPSGAGKTTFADLLVGLIAPQSGSITVGGTDLDESTLPEWRAAVGYVVQDPFLFHDTLRRNLLWARPSASETELWDALALVGADALARRTPQGLDAIVGERGGLLSGGERQRIALARAVLRKPRLLVLDEATSAMDLASEDFVLSRLLTLEQRPTIVIIAHRRESLRPCSRTLRFSDGALAPVNAS